MKVKVKQYSEGVAWGYGDLDACLAMYNKLAGKADEENYSVFETALLEMCYAQTLIARPQFEAKIILRVLEILHTGDVSAAQEAGAMVRDYDLVVGNPNKPSDFNHIVNWTSSVLYRMAWHRNARPTIPIEAIVSCLGIPASKIRQMIVMLLG